MTNWIFWALALSYVATVPVPRLWSLLFGRRCPHCQTGRATFGGLLSHPWRSLRSWWQCQACDTVLHESRWGRLNPRHSHTYVDAECVR